MRRVSCDQYEFDPPDSEQSLELAIAAPSSHCPDLRTLLRACGASSDQGPSAAAGWPRWSMVAEHLARFAGLELPRPTGLRQTLLLRDDWDDVELGVAYGSLLVWYHWSTSA